MRISISERRTLCWTWRLSVRVSVGYTRLGNSSAVMGFELHNEATGEALAKGQITQVFVDPATRGSTPIPDVFRAAVTARQPELASAPEPA